MKKKILITGICGFIGFHLSQALLKRGDAVVGLDNFNAYYTPELKRARERHLGAQGIEIIEADLSDKALLQKLFKKHSFTHVLHLAAQAGVRYARENPEAYIKSNVEGFLAVLETLRHHPETVLTYASSSSVYGCNEKIPFSTTDRTDRPANLYAATKKAGELMAYSYHHLYGIKTTGLRYFTVYGPWGRPDMAYYSFTDAILKGDPIRLFNQGQMARDFTYIDDVVAGTISALDLGAGYEVFNLGNHRPEPLLRLVEILEKELGKKAKIILEKPSPGEVETTYADIALSTEKLGFFPKTNLEEGLARFVHWYRTYHL